MTVARPAAEMLAGHTTLKLECLERLYLNVPMLQTGAGASWFFRTVRGKPVP